MTTKTESGQSAHPAEQQSQADGGTPSVADRVGDLLGQQAPAAPEGNEESAAQAPTSIELDLGGGVKQSVLIADLASLWAQKSSIDNQQQAANDLLARTTGARELIAAIDRHPDGVKQQLLRAIQDPSVLGAAPNEPGQPDTFDRIRGAVSGSGPRAQGNESELAAQVAVLAEQQKQVLGFIGQQQQAQQAQQLGDRIDHALDSMPVFKGSKEGRDWARQTMLLEAGNNPQADLDQLAAGHAAKLHKMQVATPIAPPRDQRSQNTFQVQPPETPPTADDLSGGNIADKIAQMFSQQSG